MILDEPTRGIDVGAKAEIYRLMRDLADGGAVILMISSDMEEILNVSDRIAVMHEGEITGVLERADCNEENVMQLAVGKKIPRRSNPPFKIESNEKRDRNFCLLVVLCAVTGFQNPLFFSEANLANTANLVGLYGIFSIGTGMVIITGGIDLSVGSMIALNGVLLVLALDRMALAVAAGGVVCGSRPDAFGGGAWFAHYQIQDAAVHRDLVRPVDVSWHRALHVHDTTRGFGDATGFQSLQKFADGKFCGLPTPFTLLIIISVIMWIVLHRSVYGRYLLAAGRNEEATRFSGVNTQLVIGSSYVLAGLLTGISGVLFAFYTNSVSPSTHGNFYELYGIAAAVLGGCSLRGGEGSIIGILIGTALLLVLQNLVNLLGIDSSLNFAVMGAVVLIGVLADQILQNRARKRASR